MKASTKVRIDKSTIEGYDKGLFATVDIKKGDIIAEFKGKICAPDEKETNPSNIFFNDNSILVCHDTDPASCANDCINFAPKMRDLLPALNSDEPFYRKHKGTTLNATIKIDDYLHRAFLIAGVDITKGDEIFRHYGFQYWLAQEIMTVGFSEKIPGELKRFPDRLFDYPAFTAYIHEFYEGVTKIETKQYDDTTNIILHMKNKETFCFPMQDLSSQITATYE